jgi:hypothetical protein
MLSTDEHMPVHPDDMEFLSRFHVIKICPNHTEEWDEYIEPLTIHARHPNAFATCGSRQGRVRHSDPRVPNTYIQDTAYVLLQNGYDVERHTKHLNRVRHYFLDAGTSTFDSSLFWFTCGYSQNNVSFDQVYGWEYTLLEPNNFWSRVPEKWKPFWHFYNVPIAESQVKPNSAVTFIKNLALPGDFVSFKLDIDTPEVEVPIALDILNDPGITSLIDEFFFELHFRCDFLMNCGWGSKMPEVYMGLKLDRPRVLEFFGDLRRKGIRAHFWP